MIGGLAAVAGSYDGFIIDMWGVLHDGTEAFPAAVAALGRLRADGKSILLLSNAPRRAAVLAAQIDRLGIGGDLYDHVLSSGEAVYQALARRDHPFFAALGRRLGHLGPDGDDDLFAGLDYRAVGMGEADFILNSGPLDPAATVEGYRALLELGIRRSLPMVCANPDLVVMRQGRPVVCAGAFAARYEELGGRVERRGKPDPAIYAEALARLGTAPARTLCIGDGMPTDIVGAASAGLDSLLVTGGIHAAELGSPPDPARLRALVERYGARPTAVMEALVW
jgi:HAD superfamily hydrolase (TIGR01459 family)